MQRARGIATAAFVMIGLGGIFLARHPPWLLPAFAFLLVVALGRSDLPWLARNPATRILRRTLRVLVYFPPLLVVGLPSLRTSVAAIAAGLAIGLIPIFFELHNLRVMFSPAYLTVSPVTATNRTMDIISFSLSGVCQEYLYRGLILAALLGWSRPGAVVISTLAFVAEHLLHLGGRAYWDLQDVIIHTYLGLALGTLVVLTGSLTAAMAGHTLYNLPNLLLAIRRPSTAKNPPPDDLAFYEDITPT
jgi:Type II CAAX prenyl endopeptidase Rce1-like